MPHLQVNDIKMYYEIYGQGEPVVLVSGFSNDHVIWMQVVDLLKANYQVIVFDNRGTGQTDVPAGPYSISQMASDVAVLCDKLEIKRAHFVGNSMGGFILQVLAHEYSRLVKSITLSNTAMNTHCGFHFYVAGQYELLKANAPLSALLRTSCAWAFSYRFLASPNRLEQLIELGLANPYPFTLQAYAGQYAALDAFDSSAWVHNIAVPVLVIGADQDLIFLEALHKGLADKIPGAAYYGFKECGHLPFVEYPEQFSAVVSTFINDHR